MRLKILYCLLVFQGSLVCHPVWAQQVQADSGIALFSCLEEYYGTNTLLANGRLYNPANTRAARHPYFMADEWSEGAIYVKGRTFSSLRLKYNLETGQLVLKQELKNGAPVNVVLTEALVDSFRIGQHLFVKLPLLEEAGGGSGFLERIYSGGFSFYRKQKKAFIATYSSRAPYGKFSEPENSFFLLINSQIREVHNRKALPGFFAPHQKAIKKYMNRQRIRLNKASDAQLIQLLEYCAQLE
ncbi:MAG: hypothetical protein H6557_07115 [Lewinellaceae bacterium]|nr:hypothetical protein [Phaeodactylibacter sp.]MCB9036373.1 hypothetical protein [Lewinellaceae bacterium]